MFSSKIKSKFKNKRGDVSLFFALCIILLFWIILFVIDLFRLTHTYLEAASTIRVVSETVSQQGGVATTKPVNFPSANKYVTTSNLNNFVADSMLGIGVSSGDLTMSAIPVGSTTKTSIKLGSGASGNLNVDYGNEINLVLRFGFKFTAIPKLSEDGHNVVFKINRTVKSTYKHRNQAWDEGDPNA